MFGLDGRHQSTKDATTPHDVYTFQYDAAGALASITDGDGLVTTITARGASTTDVVSPRGVTTTVQVERLTPAGSRGRAVTSWCRRTTRSDGCRHERVVAEAMRQAARIAHSDLAQRSP